MGLAGSRREGGRVEIGCWEERQASLCCCRKNCRTMLLSLLFAASSQAVAGFVLGASFLEGGVCQGLLQDGSAAKRGYISTFSMISTPLMRSVMATAVFTRLGMQVHIRSWKLICMGLSAIMSGGLHMQIAPLQDDQLDDNFTLLSEELDIPPAQMMRGDLPADQPGGANC